MNKKILITCTDSMMMQFITPHVFNFIDNGYEVTLACSEVRGRIQEVRDYFRSSKIIIHQVKLYRNPFKLSNIKGYNELKHIIKTGGFDYIWTNEPVMGMATRLAARTVRRSGTKVVYMAHGLHFYKGAPKLNWLVYYPIEKALSRITDLMILINREDYELARRRFKANNVKYLNGIGINVSKFSDLDIDRNKKLKELNLPDDASVFLSVGELEKRKNHETEIKAFALTKAIKENAHLLIAGIGSQENELKDLALKMNIEKNVHFLGYRKDIGELCKVADIFVLVSLQEGLSVAIMEAMICGLPVITSRIRGNIDEIDEGKGGYHVDPKDYQEAANRMDQLFSDKDMRNKFGKYNEIKAESFSIDSIKQLLIRYINEL